MHSLRTKIAYLTLIITILAVAAVTFTSVSFIQRQEHEESNQLLLLLCETGERNLDYYFTSVEKSVQNVGLYAEKHIRGLDDSDLSQHVKMVEEYFEIVANKTNGVLTYYYRIDPTFSSEEKGFWYTNLDGTDFVPHEVTEIPVEDVEDTSKLVWFTVPKHENKSVWLPPYFTDSLNNVEVISYNIPIHYKGKFIGVIGIEIDYTMMAEQVDSIRLYNNGYAFLTDERGSLIFHPRMDIAEMSEEEKPKMPDGAFTDSTFTRYTFEGKEKVAAWLRLSNGMRLYVSVPEDETEGNWRSLVRQVLLVAGGIVAAALVATLFLASRITRPLKQLTEAAKQTDQGNYDFTLDYRGKDEVGTLTKTFRRMADHMKNQISDLNRRANVDALTSVRNKGAFTTYIETLQSDIDSGKTPAEFAIAVFDCDNLKTVNDDYGHDKGDMYLKNASHLICKVFQHSPVFRVGGDEFTVILRNDDYRNRAELIDSFGRAMTATQTPDRNPWERVSVAMGLAVYDRAQDSSVIDTMRRADKMMYTDKRNRKQSGQ